MYEVVSQLVGILAPVIACVAIGVVIGFRGISYPSDLMGQLVLVAGAPCLVLHSIAKVELTSGALAALALASVAVLLVFVVVYVLLLKLLGLPVRTFLAPLVFSNCGNLGLPLSLFAFGERGFGVSVVVFAIWTVLQFVTAELFWSGRPQLARALRSPITYAGPIGLAFALTETPLPAWLANTTSLVGSITVPLMLITLGVSLKRLHVADLTQGLVLSVLRIGVGGLLAYGVGVAMGLDSVENAVLVLHAAMPTAVANYVFALRHDRQPEQVASFLVTSTLLSIITVPALFWLIGVQRF